MKAVQVGAGHDIPTLLEQPTSFALRLATVETSERGKVEVEVHPS